MRSRFGERPGRPSKVEQGLAMAVTRRRAWVLQSDSTIRCWLRVFDTSSDVDAYFYSMGTRDSCSQRMSIRDSDHQLFNFTYVFVLTWPRDHG